MQSSSPEPWKVPWSIIQATHWSPQGPGFGYRHTQSTLTADNKTQVVWFLRRNHLSSDFPLTCFHLRPDESNIIFAKGPLGCFLLLGDLKVMHHYISLLLRGWQAALRLSPGKPARLPSLYLILTFAVCSLLRSVQFSRSVMFESLWPHGPQHARPPCPSACTKTFWFLFTKLCS